MFPRGGEIGHGQEPRLLRWLCEWDRRTARVDRGEAMGTKLTTVSVRLDSRTSVHVDKAAHVLHQSKGAFLAQAGEEAAEHVLLQWAVEQYAARVASLSELAAETRLPLERIAQHVAEGRAEEATEMYLASCQKLSGDF